MKIQATNVVALIGVVGAKSQNSSATATGRAIVVNKCEYNVYLHGVPMGLDNSLEIERILAPSGRYEQHFTSQANGNGWSLRLSKDGSFNDVLQYDYAWHPAHSPTTIQYEVKQINGTPWKDDFSLSATGHGCTSERAGPREATDDLSRIRSCPSDAVITLALCDSANYVGKNSSEGIHSSSSTGASFTSETFSHLVFVTSSTPRSSPFATTVASPLGSSRSSVPLTQTSATQEVDTLVIVEVNVGMD